MGAGLLSLLLLSAVSLAVCDEVAEVLEDDLVVVEVGDYGSGSGEAEEEELCDTGSGEEEPAVTVTQTATYGMVTPGSAALSVEIQLQRRSDDRVQLLCGIKQEPAEGSGAAAEPELFPASLYLIRDEAVCGDLATAVGHDITTSAVLLAGVAGPGTATEQLPVTWAEVRQGNCIALLRQGEEVEEEEGSGGAGRRLPRQQSSCGRRRPSILTVAASPATRSFTALNLAAFSLVSVGVTSAFYVAAVAAAPAVQSSGGSATADSYSLEGSLLLAAPVTLALGYYLVLGPRILPFVRRNDSFRRKASKHAAIPLAARVDAVQDSMAAVIRSLDLEPLRRFGSRYVTNLRRGPLGLLLAAGSRVVSAVRRSWDSGARRRGGHTHYRRQHEHPAY